MANYANIAGPRARNDRTDERRAAALLAALWPSSLGAGHRRPHPERAPRWRRHLSNGALAAVLLGLAAVGGPSMIHPGEGGHWLKAWTPPQSSSGSNSAYWATGHGSSSGDLGDTHAHGAPGGSGPHGLQTTPVLEAPGDHPAFERQELKGDTPFLSELSSYGPTRTHFFGAGYGGRAGGWSGGGGGGGAPGGAGPFSGGPGQSGQQQDLAPPTEAPPGQDTPPHYVVDPADGPHDPTEGWTPTTQPLSAVPEPQAWLMMLFGFGTLGCMLRSRRRQPLRSRA